MQMSDLDSSQKEIIIRKIRKEKLQDTELAVDFLGEVVKANNVPESPQTGLFGGLFHKELKDIQAKFSPLKKSKLVSIDKSVEQISTVIGTPCKSKEEPQMRIIKSEKKYSHVNVLDFFDQFLTQSSGDGSRKDDKVFSTPVKFLTEDEESRKTPLVVKPVDISKSDKRRSFARYFDNEFENTLEGKEIIKERWSLGNEPTSEKKKASRKLEWNEC